MRLNIVKRIALIFTGAALLCIVPMHAPNAQALTNNWLAGWTNRYPVTVTNPNATALTNYQVKITLPSAGFDYSVGQANGNDLRVTDADGSTVLKSWTEQFSPSAKTGVMWANVPSIAANASDTLYVYTGNATAPSVSDGKATFTYFSNFNNPAWQNLTNIPAATADETAVQVNGIFYIIGGYNNSAANPLNINYAYNPATNTYVQKASMPTLRWGPIGAAVNNIIYVFGGQNTSGGVTATEAYNPTTNTWSTKAPLPTELATQGLTGCSDGTTIYLEYNGAFYVYNPAANTYTKKADLPTATRSWATCAYSNGKVYIINGYINGAINNTQIYTVATNTWSAGAPSPFALYGSIRENPIIGDNIYIVQGQQTDAEFSSAVYVYNIPTNSWTEKSFGPHAADGVAGGVYNGIIYTFGGRQDWTGPYGLTFANSYTPAADTDSNWYQMYGNYEGGVNGLHRMVPVKGGIDNGPTYSEIQSTFQTGASYVMEAQTAQVSSNAWNTIAVNANDGYYNMDLTGYLAPYNDYGLSPQETSFYKENGTSYTKLVKSTLANGAERFKVVSSPSSVALYRNNILLGQTADTTYRGGHIQLISAIPNNSSVNFLFVRSYATVEPTVSFGYQQTNPTNYATCPCNLLPTSAVPNASSTANTSAYELGTRFYSETAGNVTAIRFYKEPGMALTHTGHLWDNTGHLLASVNFTNETASGWQVATLTTPLTIAANTAYIVSYHISGGPFAYNQSQLANQGVNTPPLHIFQDGVAGVNGVFTNGDVLAYPTSTWSSTNYWADVVFQ